MSMISNNSAYQRAFRGVLIVRFLPDLGNQLRFVVVVTGRQNLPLVAAMPEFIRELLVHLGNDGDELQARILSE
jgi:hypothetical protein